MCSPIFVSKRVTSSSVKLLSFFFMSSFSFYTVPISQLSKNILTFFLSAKLASLCEYLKRLNEYILPTGNEHAMLQRVLFMVFYMLSSFLKYWFLGKFSTG